MHNSGVSLGSQLSPASPALTSLSHGSWQSAHERLDQFALAPLLFGIVLYVILLSLSLGIIVLKLRLCVPVVFFLLLFIASGGTLGVYVLFKKLLNGFPHWLLCWVVYEFLIAAVTNK